MEPGHTIVAVLAITLGLGAPIALIGLLLWYKSRKTRLIHETALRLAEKGQPVPPELFMGKVDLFSDLRRGIILSGLGIGLSLFMYQLNAPWSVGLIPIFMGAGYLILWKLDTNKNGDRKLS